MESFGTVFKTIIVRKDEESDSINNNKQGLPISCEQSIFNQKIQPQQYLMVSVQDSLFFSPNIALVHNGLSKRCFAGEKKEQLFEVFVRRPWLKSTSLLCIVD